MVARANTRYATRDFRLSNEHRAFRLAVVQAVTSRSRCLRFGTSPIRVMIDSYWPKVRRLAIPVPLGDVDSVVKSTLDALQSAEVYEDDAQVVELIARKHLDRSRPKPWLRVEIEEVEGYEIEG